MRRTPFAKITEVNRYQKVRVHNGTHNACEQGWWEKRTSIPTITRIGAAKEDDQRAIENWVSGASENESVHTGERTNPKVSSSSTAAKEDGVVSRKAASETPHLIRPAPYSHQCSSTNRQLKPSAGEDSCSRAYSRDEDLQPVRSFFLSLFRRVSHTFALVRTINGQRFAFFGDPRGS